MYSGPWSHHLWSGGLWSAAQQVLGVSRPWALCAVCCTRHYSMRSVYGRQCPGLWTMYASCAICRVRLAAPCAVRGPCAQNDALRTIPCKLVRFQVHNLKPQPHAPSNLEGNNTSVTGKDQHKGAWDSYTNDYTERTSRL